MLLLKKTNANRKTQANEENINLTAYIHVFCLVAVCYAPRATVFINICMLVVMMMDLSVV